MVDNNPQNINTKVTLEGDDNTKAVVDALAAISEKARDAAASLTSITSVADRAERALVGLGGSTREFVQELGDAAIGAAPKQIDTLAQAFSELQQNIAASQKAYRDFNVGQTVGIGTGMAYDQFDKGWLDKMVAARKAASADLVSMRQREVADDKRMLDAIAASHTKNAMRRTDEERKNFTLQKQAAFDASQDAIKFAQERNRAEVEASKKTRDAELANLKAVIQARSAANAEAVKQAQASAKASAQGRAKELADMRSFILGGGSSLGKSLDLSQFHKTLKMSYSDIDVLNDKLSNTRYALHDVSMTMGITGAAILAGTGLIVKASADYETAIASIQRTSEMSSKQAQQVRNDFVSLAQEIPAAFSEIAQVGELAGQLNVPADRIAQFSESVLKFSATTNVTAESSATAFGRLDALLPDVKGNYDALGSSILKVGINSVATEQEIISTTSQIAAAGAQAGLTASQVIGLSASFASLGIAPEAARGTVVRILGIMNKAIAQNGAALQEFADISNMSAKDFANSWGKPEFGQTILNFLNGLQKEGNQAQLALSNLGISAVRDQNNLLKLSQNTDLVVNALADAQTGFQNSAFLADNFAIKANTLNAKVQVLVNSIQALAAEAGQSGAGALGGLIDVLNGILKASAEFVKIPIVQTLIAVAGGFTAMAGVVALAGAGLTRFAASGLALPNIINQANQMLAVAENRFLVYSRAANAAGVANSRFMSTAIGVKGALSGITSILGTVTKFIGPYLALTAAIEVGTFVFNEMKSPVDKAKDALGSFGAVVDATTADAEAAVKQYGSIAEAVEKSNGAFSTVEVSIDGNNQKLAESELAAQIASGGQDTLAKSVENTTDKLKDQTLVLGANFRASMLEALKAVDGFNAQFTKLQQANPAKAEGYLTALMRGDTEGAKKVIEDFRKWQFSTEAGQKSIWVFNEPLAGLEPMMKALEVAKGAIQGAGVEASVAAAYNKIFGDSAETAGLQYNQFGEQVDAAGEVVATTNEVVANSFEALTGVQGAVQAMNAVTEAFYGVSGGAGAMGGAVIMNADTIQKAVEATILAGKGMGIDATQSVAALFDALQKKGIDTAELLAALAGMTPVLAGGVQIKDIQKLMKNQNGLTDSTKRLSDMYTQLGNSGGVASDGMNKANEAAKKAKEEFRTMVDYANDLEKVWKRAFEIRFGPEIAKDTITKQLHSIRDAAAASASKIADLRLKLKDLAAAGKDLASRKEILLYFRNIASLYNNTERVNAIDAEIAQIDADIAKNKKDVADTTKDLTKEQKDSSKTLKGNSDAAIKNRADVRSLATSYQDYIAALVKSGASQKEINKAIREAKRDFIEQGDKIGYNRKELKKYADVFSDVKTAVDKVPKNVTVKVDIKKPAQSAWNELQKPLNDVATATGKIASNLSKIPTYVPKFDLAALKRYAELTALEADLDDAKKNYKSALKSGADNLAMRWLKRIKDLKKRISTFASGGFTGRGAKYEEAGIVHRGEYVIPKEGVNQSTGLPDMAWMMRNVLNMTGGGDSAGRISNLTTINNMAKNGGIQLVRIVSPVDLGATSIHAIAASTDKNVSIDGQTVAKVTAKNYANDTGTGAF